MEIILSGGLVGKKWAHPTDSATGLVESSDTNTWQANLWSAGCFVIKPKYLQKCGNRAEATRRSQTALLDWQKGVRIISEASLELR